MPLTETDRDNITATITDLRQRLDALPSISISSGTDIMDQHRRHRAAAEDLGRYLSATYGARIAERHDANRITMLRITSTSTSGLRGAFGNWITAAEKRLKEGTS